MTQKQEIDKKLKEIEGNLEKLREIERN